MTEEKKSGLLSKMTWRIWLLVIILIFSLLAIFGNPTDLLKSGVIITGVEGDSIAFNEGLRQGQIITHLDGQKIETPDEFLTIIGEKFSGEGNVKTIITTETSEYILFSETPPEIIVSKIPKTNLKTGLDISGGSRALIQPEGRQLNSEELRDLIDITNNRLNVYGISDLKVAPVSDLAGNNYMLIEVAGATPDDLENLISQQGKFEAKIGEEVAFIGGERDITSVCRNDATCASIRSCSGDDANGYLCTFSFTIFLSDEAAKRHADITSAIDISTDPSQQGAYLAEPLDLYLDDVLVDSLLISESLKGRVTSQISIQGSGSGATNDEALKNAEEDMKNLQTILITGSLPFKLEIVKLDIISPLLGDEFVKSILIAGLATLIAVAVIVFFRYRKFKSSLALLFTSISEVIIILGIASFIEWNLDLPSIAGILATIGTGIDQQIIVIDESRQKNFLSIKQKMKVAFAIILGAYLTSVVSLIPLWWAGAGLLKGFVFTTIIGITAGVLITRPAFTDMIKNIEE